MTCVAFMIGIIYFQMAGRLQVLNIRIVMQETSQSATSALVTSFTAYDDGATSFQTARRTTYSHVILVAYTIPRTPHRPQRCNIFVEEAGQNIPRHNNITRAYRPPGYHPPIQEMGQNHCCRENNNSFRPSGYSPPIHDTEPHTK